MHSLTVVLDRDIRVDDVEPIIHAIEQIRGMIAVKGNVADSSDFIAQSRARDELIKKLWDVFR